MSGDSQRRSKRVTVAILVAAAVTICLGIAVLIAYLLIFATMRLEIVGPRGAVVQCELLINNQGESRRETVPVTLEFPAYAKTVEFAVIPESATSGSVDVRVRAGGQKGSAVGSGVRGYAAVTPTGGRVTINKMTDQQIDAMRGPRTAPEDDGASSSTR
jgi:hypothetical protein